MQKEQLKSRLPNELYQQLEGLYNNFKEIQTEAAGLLHSSKVSDASSQLHHVLQSTEEATHTIIDTVTTISEIAGRGNLSAEDQQKLGDLVAKVYEACSFQDITGQRIKKVLASLTVIENKLGKLLETAKVYMGKETVLPVEIDPKADPLINGPQAPGEGVSQENIDKMFK